MTPEIEDEIKTRNDMRKNVRKDRQRRINHTMQERS